MNMLSLAFESAWKVLLTSIVLGAGVPALFAFGVRGWASSIGELNDDSTRHASGKVIAVVSFLVVALVIALGLSIIISTGLGYKVSFENVFPTFVKK